MKIIVCIKQVPDTTEVKLDPKTNTLIREGVPSIINPDDKAAIETALKLRETSGGTVTVISMGPAQAERALREALAMGCDDGVLLSDRAFGGSDTWATSSIIAAAIGQLEYDLIIAGRQAIDGDTAQVGPQIAEHLHLPQVSYVADAQLLPGGELEVLRQFEDRMHRLRVTLPCLLTVLSEEIHPRYMTVSGIVDAYDHKPVTVWGYDRLAESLNSDNMGLAGSPTRVVKSFVKPAKGTGTVIHPETPEAAVEAILEKLKEKHLIG